MHLRRVPARALAVLGALVMLAGQSPPVTAKEVPVVPVPPVAELDDVLASIDLPSRPEPVVVVVAPVVLPAAPVVAKKRSASAKAPSPPRAVPRRAPAPQRRSGGSLEAIKRCESGGDYRARSASGRYSGAYQFDAQTHRSVGGDGFAGDDPPAVQDAAAARLMAQRGSSPWPVCGRR